MGHEVGLQASAGRGFSPPTCIVLHMTAVVKWFVMLNVVIEVCLLCLSLSESRFYVDGSS